MIGKTNSLTSGSNSGDCTASKAQILEGFTAITKDSNDEIISGTMTNRGAISQLLNAGSSYTIPVGYHNGSGTVTANSLASQTPGNAPASRLCSGYIAWVNGNQITGSMSVGSILNFSAQAYSGRQILLKWQNPYAATGRPFSGVFINYATNGYPGTGGTRIYTGYGNNSASGGWSQVIVTLPSLNTTYYFSATAYCSCSTGDLWGNTMNFAAATQANQWHNTGTSTSFTAPYGYTNMDIYLVGGGGGGKGQQKHTCPGDGGGGGGYTSTLMNIPISGGETVMVVVGAGGASNCDGGSSAIYINGNLIGAASGGLMPKTANYYGGNGGSGGGSGGAANAEFPGGDGGSNGGNGSTWKSSWLAGSGQGSTTYPYGNAAWNTLYSGGGGGGAGALDAITKGTPGNGGLGGGGRGGDPISNGSNGSANTGGGGGGGGAGFTARNKGGIGGTGGSGFVMINIE